jgi:hypothetical protein
MCERSEFGDNSRDYGSIEDRKIERCDVDELGCERGEELGFQDVDSVTLGPMRTVWISRLSICSRYEGEM